MKRYENVELMRSLLRKGNLIKEVAVKCREMELLELLGEKVVDPEFSKLIQETITHEFVFQSKIFDKFGFSVLFNKLVQARVEYLLKILTFWLENMDEGHEISVLIDSCFDFYKRILSLVSFERQDLPREEEDFLSVSNSLVSVDVIEDETKILGSCENLAGKTYWHLMCLSSLSYLQVRLLKKFPSARAAISLSNLEVLSILLSPAWQNQYLALGILYAGLLLEAAQLSSVNIQRSSSSSRIPTSTSLMKSSSSKSYKKGNDHSSSSKISGKEGSGKRIPQKSKSRIKVDIATDPPLDSGSSRKSLFISTKSSEELFRCGFLRTLSCLLLHRVQSVRFLASEVLLVLLKLSGDAEFQTFLKGGNSVDSVSTGTSQTVIPMTISDFWSSLAEQGTIPLLQSILVGFPIHTKPTSGDLRKANLFPEISIRSTIKVLFRGFLYHLKRNQLLRQRILQSLQYNGNLKLRVNILSSLLVMIGHSPSFSSVLFRNSSNSGVVVPSEKLTAPLNGSVLWQFLLTLLESQDFKPIFSLINYFMENLIRYYQKMLFKEVNRSKSQLLVANEMATQTTESRFATYRFRNLSVNTIHPKLLQLMVSISKTITPVIVISSTGQTSTSGIRMSCPTLELIHKFGGGLASLIEKQHHVQIEQCFIFFQEYFATEILSSSVVHSAIDSGNYGSSTYMKYEREFKAIHNNLSDHYFVKLEGNYQLWQEIFAHFTDNQSLFQTLFQKLPLSVMIDCLTTASQYSMDALTSRYLWAILRLKKVAANTLLPILRALSVIQSRIEEKDRLQNDENVERLQCEFLRLLLYRECIHYFLNDFSFLSKRKKSSELGEVMKCIYLLLERIFRL